MSIANHIIIFIVVGVIWVVITSYFFPSRYEKLVGVNSVKSTVTEDEDDIKIIYETPKNRSFQHQDIIQVYKRLTFLSYFTTSGKSKLEYDRSLGVLNSFLKKYNAVFGKPVELPSMNYDKPIKVNKSPDICPEKVWDLTDPIFLKSNPISEWYSPLWMEPPLLPGCTAPPLNSLVTIVFNFASEIPIIKAETLLLDAAACRYKGMHMIALIRNHEYFDKLKKLANENLPNMQVIESQNSAKTLASDLQEAVSFIKTKYVVLTRNTERFDNFSLIIRLVRDVSNGKSVIVGGSQRNISGHWKSGCYQVKQGVDQVHYEEGYDNSDDGCMVCDYLSTPFGTRTEFISNYLNTNRNSVLNGDAFYMELFLRVQEMRKPVFMCVDSMFFTETSGIQTKNKSVWLPFVKKFGFSKVTVNFPDQRHTLEYTCKEISLSCAPKETGLNHCCYKEAENILQVIINKLLALRISYRFELPVATIFWMDSSNSKNNIVVVEIKGENSVSGKIQYDGFNWIDGNFVSRDWKFIFKRNDQISSVGYNIRFGNLLLPVKQNPGEVMESDFISECPACFNLLWYSRSLDSQKIWL